MLQGTNFPNISPSLMWHLVKIYKNKLIISYTKLFFQSSRLLPLLSDIGFLYAYIYIVSVAVNCTFTNRRCASIYCIGIIIELRH